MFSTSLRAIFQVILPPAPELSSKSGKLSSPIIAHDNSVYKLHFDNDGGLWTPSADKTAKRLVRENGWVPDTILQHPDFVRDVVTHDKYGLIITACCGEESEFGIEEQLFFIMYSAVTLGQSQDSP